MSCYREGGGGCSSRGGMEKIIVDLMQTHAPNVLQKLLNNLRDFDVIIYSNREKCYHYELLQGGGCSSRGGYGEDRC